MNSCCGCATMNDTLNIVTRHPGWIIMDTNILAVYAHIIIIIIMVDEKIINGNNVILLLD